MRNLFYSFFLLSIFSISGFSQIQVDFTSAQATPGGTIDIDVNVRNFEQIVSAQFSINWDPSVFTYNTILNATTVLPNFAFVEGGLGNIGVPPGAAGIDEGEITVSWSEANTLPVSIPDNTLLFTIRLNAVGAACDMTTLTITDTPSQREVVDENFNILTITANGGETDIEGTNCDGGGGGGNECDDTDAASMIISDDIIADPGASICVPVTGRNFSDISSVQVGFSWDPTILSYQSVNGVGLTGEILNENNTSSGELRYLWLDNTGTTPISVADGGTILELCFNVVGSIGQASEIFVGSIPSANLQTEITGPGGTLEDCTQPGTLTVRDDNTGGGDECDNTSAASMIISDEETAEAGTTICIPVTGRNFTDISSVQVGFSWDPSILSYNNVNGVGLTGEILNENNTGTGELRYLWVDNTGTTPVSVADGGTILELCFDVVGDTDEFSEVFVGSIPSANLQTEITGPGGTLEDCTQPGTFTVDEGDVQPDNCNTTDKVAFIVPSMMAEQGTNICIPVTARNFSNVAAFTAGVRWNSSVLEYQSINGVELTGETINANNSANGSLNYLWQDASGSNPANVANGNTLFEVCFRVLGTAGQNATVEVTDLNNFNIEVATPEGTVLETCLLPGTFTVSQVVGPPMITFTIGSATINSGEEVCIPVSTENFADIQSAQFNVEWDESILSYSRLINGDLPDFGSSNATFIQPNKLRVSWNPFVPVTLPDNSTLFQVCFNGTPCSPAGTTQTSTIDFVDDNNIVIEVSNGSGEVVEVRTETGSVSVNCMVIEEPCGVNVSNISPAGCNGEATGSITVDRICSNRFTCVWRDSGGNVENTSEQTCNLTGVGPGSYSYTITFDNGSTFTGTHRVDRSTSPSVSARNTSATCFEGGLVDLTVSGGTPAYRYSWEGPDGFTASTEDINDLSAGTYRVTVTDNNGCSDTGAYAVGGVMDNNPPSIVSTDISHRSCDNPTQSIGLQIDGGCAPLRYSWTGPSGETRNTRDISNVPFGTWRVTVTDDGGRMVTGAYTIEDRITPLQINLVDIMDASCGTRDGRIEVDVTGGCGEFRCSWNNGQFNICNLNGIVAGEYTLVVSDTRVPNVTATRTFTIGDGGMPFTASFAVTDPSNEEDNNGAIDVTINGGNNNFSFEWSDGNTNEDRTGLGSGDYSVIIRDNVSGCVQNFTVRRLTNVIIISNITSTGSTTCPGEQDAVIEGSVTGGCGGPLTITLNGASVDLPIQNLAPDEYTLVISDDCGNMVTENYTIIDAESIALNPDITCADVDDENGSVILNISGGSGDFSITTSVGDIEADSIVTNVPIGSITVLVEDSNGCQVAEQDIQIPNCNEDMIADGPCSDYRSIISPNGDGVNDSLLIGCAGDTSNQPNTFSVYDRWGKLVYSQDNYDNSWQGTDNNGVLLNENGYMWVLEINTSTKREIAKGSVTLLRSSY